MIATLNKRLKLPGNMNIDAGGEGTRARSK